MKTSENLIKHNRTNRQIELYRFVFALIIYLFHCGYVLHVQFFPKGYLGVEFFFVLSGFFLAKHLEKNTCFSLFDYLLKKIKKFFPIHALCWISMALICIGIYGISSQIIFSKGLIELLLLDAFGFKKVTVNGVIWYLSVYLVGIYLISFLRIKIGKSSFIYIAPVLILLGYSICLNFFGNLNVSQHFQLIRGVSGLLLGYVSYEIFNYYSKRYVSSFVLDLLQILCFVFLIINCLGIYVSYVLFPVCCSIVIIISFINNGFLNRLYDFRIFEFLGSLSLGFYLTQNVSKHLIRTYIFSNYHFNLSFQIIILVFANIVLSVLFIYISELVSKILKKAF